MVERAHDQRGDGPEPVGADEVDQAVLAAWRTLPDGSRALLWRLVVHGEQPRHHDPGHGAAPDGISDPGERALDRLRLGLLSELVARAAQPECAAARRRLAVHMRNPASVALGQPADAHLESCSRCRTAIAVLDDLDTAIRDRVASILLPGAFATHARTPPAERPADVTAGTVTEGPAAARVLSVPGRSAMVVLASASLGLAAMVFVLGTGPNGEAAAGAASPRAGSSATHPGAPALESRDAAAAERRSMIGVAVPETGPANGSPAPRPSPVEGAPSVEVGSSAEAVSSVEVRSSAEIATPLGVATPLAVARPARTGPVPAPAPSGPHPLGDTPAGGAPTVIPSRPVGPPVVPDAVTTVAFEPLDHGTFVARLEVSSGWVVTSVVDARGRRLVEHVSAPVLQLETRLHAGRVVVAVRRVTGRGRQGPGVLAVSFVGPSGAVLPGSGSYALR